MRARPVIVCFGEVMWDCVPRGLFLGGAPVNVAWHLHRHGARALPLTAIGRDFLGDEMLRRLTADKLDTRFITRHARRPTGTVQAILDRAGVPTFRIRRDVAWDRIDATPILRRTAPPDALVYGSLALRETSNRRALASLLGAWPGTLRVADLNLRPPFDTPAAISLVLAQAQLLKLNEHELAQLAGRNRRTVHGLEQSTRDIARRHAIPRICVTAGSRGAGLLWDGEWRWEAARRVKVRDTIGAGDAFLAGLLAGLLVRRQGPRAALAHACRMGEFVAARDGSMPSYRCGPRGRPLDSAD